MIIIESYDTIGRGVVDRDNDASLIKDDIYGIIRLIYGTTLE